MTYIISKNFLRGMGSVLNLFPDNRPIKSIEFTPILPDQEAFKKDLEQVGHDIWGAIETINHEEYMVKNEKLTLHHTETSR